MCVIIESRDSVVRVCTTIDSHGCGVCHVANMSEVHNIKSIQQVAVEDGYEQCHPQGDSFGVPGGVENVSTMWPQNTDGSLSSHGDQYPGRQYPSYIYKPDDNFAAKSVECYDRSVKCGIHPSGYGINKE